MGCRGGYLTHAWEFLHTKGAVSDACYPYTSGTGTNGRCSHSCTSGENAWNPHKATQYNTFTTIESIKTEIYTNGPI